MDILEQFERNNKRLDSSSRFQMDNIRQGSLFHGVHIAEELAVPAEEMSSPQRDSQQHWPHSIDSDFQSSRPCQWCCLV